MSALITNVNGNMSALIIWMATPKCEAPPSSRKLPSQDLSIFSQITQMTGEGRISSPAQNEEIYVKSLEARVGIGRF